MEPVLVLSVAVAVLAIAVAALASAVPFAWWMLLRHHDAISSLKSDLKEVDETAEKICIAMQLDKR